MNMVMITLSDAEVTALTSEKLDPKESLESVIHRQIEPLVQRLATDSFKAFVETYAKLPVADKVTVLTAIEKLPEIKTKPGHPPVAVHEEVPVVLDLE